MEQNEKTFTVKIPILTNKPLLWTQQQIIMRTMLILRRKRVEGTKKVTWKLVPYCCNPILIFYQPQIFTTISLVLVFQL
jgi:hypothetical protein